MGRMVCLMLDARVKKPEERKKMTEISIERR